MPSEKNIYQNNKQKNKEDKHIKPSDIKGKIDINDTRERRDGPGGN